MVVDNGTSEGCNGVAAVPESHWADDACLAAEASVLEPLWRPRSILVDFCGVVCDGSGWSRWLCRLISRFSGMPLDYATFTRNWYEHYIVRLARDRASHQDALRSLLASFSLPDRLMDELCLAASARRRDFQQSEHALPGVREALVSLRHERLTVGLLAICDWDAIALQDDLQRMGLSALFDYVVCSDAQPLIDSHGKILWAHIAQRLGYACRDMVLVSAHPDRLNEAQQSGMVAIGINADPLQWQGPTVQHISELAYMLAQPRRLAV